MTACGLLDAHKNGYTSKLIPGIKVCSFFTRPVVAEAIGSGYPR